MTGLGRNGDPGGISTRAALGLVLIVMALGLVTDPEPGIDPIVAAVLLMGSGLLLLGIDVFAGVGAARRNRKDDDR